MAVTALTGPKSAATEHDKPSFVAPAYELMAPRWKLCRDVMTGTEAVRADANLDLYFPRGAAETSEERKTRSQRPEFFPLFKETVKGLVGLAFRKKPVLGSDVPAPIKVLAENIDGAGTALHVFARRVFEDAVIKGHSAILVDVPKVSSTRALTRSDDRDMGLRPYWVHVRPEQIINWRTQTINGHTVLTLLVLRETIDVPSGAYGVATVDRYRVFRRDTATGKILYEVWVQGEDTNDPEMEDDGELKNSITIPFVVVYAGERIAPLQSLPPLIDLAYTNVAHVQVLSDQRSSLHAAGNPILVIKGRIGGGGRPDPQSPQAVGSPLSVDANGNANGSTNDDIVLGVNIGIDVDKDGDVKYAEHTGAALGATATEISAIESRAAAQGLSMLQRSTRAAQTAETEKLQRNEKDASLSSAVQSMEDALEIASAYTAIFMGLPTGGTITMDREFESTVIDTARIQAFSQATAAGQFTRRTFWKILIRGEALPEDFDMDAEEEALDTAAGGVTLNRTLDANGNPVPGSTATGDTSGGDGSGSGGGAA